MSSYDFRAPEALSVDTARTALRLFAHTCRQLANHFTQQLGGSTDVEIVGLDSQRYESLFTAFTPCAFTPIECGEALGNGMVLLSLDLFYSMLERLMGGSGATSVQTRPLTEFERFLATDLVNVVLARFVEGWGEVLTFEPRITRIDTDAKMVPRVCVPDEVFVRTRYRITLPPRPQGPEDAGDGSLDDLERDSGAGRIAGEIVVCLPLARLRRFLNALVGTAPTLARPESVAPAGALLRYDAVRVAIRAELGHVDLTLQQMLALRVGQVLTLDSEPPGRVLVSVEGSPRFLGRPAMIEDRVVVEVTEVLKEESHHGTTGER